MVEHILWDLKMIFSRNYEIQTWIQICEILFHYLINYEEENYGKSHYFVIRKSWFQLWAPVSFFLWLMECSSIQSSHDLRLNWELGVLTRYRCDRIRLMCQILFWFSTSGFSLKCRCNPIQELEKKHCNTTSQFFQNSQIQAFVVSANISKKFCKIHWDLKWLLA